MKHSILEEKYDELDDFNLPDIEDLELDESLSSIDSTINSVEVSSQIEVLEKRRDSLIETISNLTDKVKVLKQEYSENNKDLTHKILDAKKILNELKQQKIDEESNYVKIKDHEQRLLHNLGILDSKKEELELRQQELQKNISYYKNKIAEVQQREESLQKLNKALVEKENRILLKEKEIDESFSSTLDFKNNYYQKFNELKKYEENLVTKKKYLEEKENKISLSINRIHQMQLQFNTEKQSFISKTKGMHKKFLEISQREEEVNFIRNKAKDDLRQAEKDKKKYQSLLKDLEKRESKVYSLMGDVKTNKEILKELRNKKIEIEKDTAGCEKVLFKLKEERTHMQNEVFKLKNKITEIQNDIKASAYSHKENEKFIESQKLELTKVSNSLMKKELEIKQREIEFSKNESIYAQKKLRIDGLESQLEQRERFIVSQQESLKKEEARIQSMLLKHSNLNEKVKELEMRERDMNLKILSFEKREDALKSLEGHLAEKEKHIRDLESNSSIIELQNNIENLKKKISEDQKVTEEKNKELELVNKKLLEIQEDGTELSEQDSINRDEIKKLNFENANLKSSLDSSKIAEDALRKQIVQLNTTLKEVEENKINFVDKDEEVRVVLQITDDLLENLPEEVLRKFVQSDNFKIFEKVFKKYNI